MNYQVLARKWRPQNFAQLVGQEHVVTAISNALDNNRLHHAYLFTGTRGVGKTTIARIFSKSLNCEQGMSSTPCGQCPTCQEIDQGRFIDLLEIDAASRTKVEDTRELLDNVQYKPTRGQYKVYLIDEVHMLSKHSFNALLKTLEEPPPHVKFLLATTDPQKLPVTILSRCLQFNLKAMSREQISGQLGYILGEEGLKFEPEALAQLARAANGSMRDALSLTDQAIAQGNGQVNLAVVTDMLGLMDKNQVLKLLKAILEGQNQQMLQQLDDLASQSVDYSQLLAELLSLLHQVALTQMVPEVCKLETIAARAIYHLASSVPAEQIQLLYQIALQGRKDLPYAMDGRSGIEMTLLRMLAFNPQRQLSSAQFIAQNQPVAQPPAAAAAAEQSTDFSGQEAESTAIDQQQLNQQQEHIWQQAEQFHSRQEPTDNLTIEAETVESAPNETEHEPERPSLIEQPSSPLSQTESLLALRRGLRQNQQEASQPKKPEAVEPAVELNQPELPPLAEPDFVADHTDAQSIEPEPEPESAEPLQTTPVPNESGNSEIPPWALSVNQLPAIAEDETQTPELDMQDLLNQVVDVPVNIDIPTFLDDGQKVTQAKQLDNWSDIIEQSGVGGLTKQLALQSSMHKQDSLCQLTLPEALQHLNNDTARIQLQSALSELWQQPVELQVDKGEPENTPFAIQQSINKMRQQYAQQVINSDTNIQFFQQQFDAQLVENSIEPR
ncbi:DNA polymerase III subunit gamma/tau [Neptunicella sp. SCSIO 80796]|uniref:DNA polymerase III subunit gamma/tau n=1 Tax=Neptunicella plasticusilytica TaxID=3117012 RepID=UPI003A4E0CBE